MFFLLLALRLSFAIRSVVLFLSPCALRFGISAVAFLFQFGWTGLVGAWQHDTGVI